MFTLRFRHKNKSYTFFSTDNERPSVRIKLSNNTSIEVFEGSLSVVRYIVIWDGDVSEIPKKAQWAACCGLKNLEEVSDAVEDFLFEMRQYDLEILAKPDKDVKPITMINLSLSHLDSKTRCHLGHELIIGTEILKDAEGNTNGYLVHFMKSELTNTLPQCLLDCLNFAASQGACVVQFHKRTSPVSQLKVYP